MYPLRLHGRWENEYKALQTESERVDWVAQKVEERKTINAVRDMKQFENSSNPPASPACQTLRGLGKVHETRPKDGKDRIDR